MADAKEQPKDSLLVSQMRAGTHFDKSTGCHGIFIGPCSWPALHSANVSPLTTHLLGPTHFCLCLLTITSKVAGYIWMEFFNSPWMLWDNGFCSWPSDTPAFSWVFGAILEGGIIQGLCFKGRSIFYRNRNTIDSQCGKLQASVFDPFIFTDETPGGKVSCPN